MKSLFLQNVNSQIFSFQKYYPFLKSRHVSKFVVYTLYVKSINLSPFLRQKKFYFEKRDSLSFYYEIRKNICRIQILKFSLLGILFLFENYIWFRI